MPIRPLTTKLPITLHGAIAVGNEVLDMCAHRLRHPAQQHDRDIALAALELRNVALGNAADLGKHLARHAAQRPRGADPLTELFEKSGFGIGFFGHV